MDHLNFANFSGESYQNQICDHGTNIVTIHVWILMVLVIYLEQPHGRVNYGSKVGAPFRINHFIDDKVVD